MASDPNSVEHKIRGHIVFAVIGLLGSAVFVLRGTFGGQSVDDAGVVAAGITGFAALAHLLLAICEPRTAGLPQGLALLLVVLAPLAFLYPAFARPDQGWPLNPVKGPREDGTIRSRIVSPGDRVSVRWTAEDITSVGARWRGRPKVEVLNAVELGCPQALPGTGRDETWERWMWTESGLEECSPFLTATFPLPDDPQLAGKSLRLRTTLPITYPAPVGRVEYVDKRKTFVREDVVLLAPLAVKEAYWASWRTGAAIGMVGTAVGGLILVLVAFGLRLSWKSEECSVPPLAMSVKPC